MTRKAWRLAGLCLLWMASGHGLAVSVGDNYNAPTVKHMTGSSPLSKDALRGKVSIINFWATWCDACKVELKEMKQTFAPLLSQDKFQFAMVSLDKDPKAAQAWVNEHLGAKEKIASFLYSDPTFAAAGALDVDAFPMTLIVGPDLKVVYVQKGFEEGTGATQALAKKAKALLNSETQGK